MALTLSPVALRSGLVALLAVLGLGLLLMLRPGTSAEADTPREVAVVYDSSETDWSDYMWPTDAGSIRTSDFAEFRKTHFHAGLDVSTGGRIGFKVFAMRDGWVHSMYFEPGGYGWFLALRHRDGYYTTYAHLDRPNDSILLAWQQALVARGASFGNVEWKEGELPVKKGDIIAYTGDTGAGPPHLHFEIRDRNFNPVNPGLARTLRPVDSLAPELRGVLLQPLDAASSIDGALAAKPLTPVGAPGGMMSIKAVPRLRGRIGLLLRAHDRANGATDYPTPYRLRLQVDGKDVFESTAMRFADTLGFHIRIDRDHALMQAMKGEFRKLYRDEGNLLEFYLPQSRDAGVLSAERLGAGRKAITVIAEDLAGHRTSARMVVELARDLRLRHSVRDGMFEAQLLSEEGCEQLRLEVADDARAAAVGSWTAAEARAGVSVDIKRYRDRQLRLVTVDDAGYEQLHALFVPGGASRATGRLYAHREIHFDEIVYDLRLAAPFASAPEVRITQGTRSEAGRVHAIDASRYRAVLPTWEGLSGTATVEVRYTVGAKEILWTDSVRGTHISASAGGQLRSEDGRFVLSFAPGDVYRSLFCTLENIGGDSLLAWRVGPADVPLAGRPVLSLLAKDVGEGAFLSMDAGMRKYGEFRQPQTGVLTARVARFLGSYAVRRDQAGPLISVEIAPRSSEALRITVRDSLSGVDLRSVVARIDDKVVPLQYHEGRGQLYVPHAVYKAANGKEVVVTSRDFAGNSSMVRKALR